MSRTTDTPDFEHRSYASLIGGRETFEAICRDIEQHGGSNIQNGVLTRTYLHNGNAIGLRLCSSGIIRLQMSGDDSIKDTVSGFMGN